MSSDSADSRTEATLGQEASRGDLRWLALAVAGALVFHFGWTVPWGPFEASPRNRVRSHEAFAALGERYQSRSFEDEPENRSLAEPMAFVVKRAVQLARTRLISAGQESWLELKDLSCRSTRCRFSVCVAPNYPDQAGPQAGQLAKAQQDSLQRALESFELSHRPAWELSRIQGPGCPRFEARFVQLPRSSCLMTLR